MAVVMVISDAVGCILRKIVVRWNMGHDIPRRFGDIIAYCDRSLKNDAA